ncbi:hypothetical protein OIU74_016761 [Salix koriyanagi]|uniref:Uncharacterized protein n=1 Tax=Salix koriyanagi TaxID=2511006 RepID=A0A9Q0PH33_9ROSI|nr:hypothetical protein OIU74_016761 [Salix koriyanagi]
MLHGREGEERKKDHRHMWTGPTRGNSVVAGDDIVSNSFFKDFSSTLGKIGLVENLFTGLVNQEKKKVRLVSDL